jgi:diguanylate cyclase (GGDEF)-like protein
MNAGAAMGRAVLRVLLVEENPEDAKRLEEILIQSESSSYPGPLFDAERVDSFPKAIDRLSLGDVDVVLLDLSFSDAQQLDLINQTRQVAPEIPIVVVTSRDDQSLAIQALQLGAQDYIVKSNALGCLLERALRYAVERHRLQMAVRSLSLIDDLTGLYNRRGFTTLAEQHLKHAARHGKNLLLVFADLDGLKLINDQFGHARGDQALIQTAALLRSTFRNSDIIARLGGDEFVVLVLDEEKDSSEVIRSRVEEEFRKFNGQGTLSFPLSLSIGLSRFNPQTTRSIEGPMALADQNLYERKRLRHQATAS